MQLQNFNGIMSPFFRKSDSVILPKGMQNSHWIETLKSCILGVSYETVANIFGSVTSELEFSDMCCLLNKPYSCSSWVSPRVWEAAILNANRETKIAVSIFQAGNGPAVSPSANYTNSYPCPNYSGDTLGTKANVLWIEVPKTKILWTYVQDGKFCVSWMELSIE